MIYEMREIVVGSFTVHTLFDGEKHTFTCIEQDVDGNKDYIDNISWIYEKNIIDRVENAISTTSYVEIDNLQIDTDFVLDTTARLVDFLVILKLAESKGWFNEGERDWLNGRK